jgi:hypothetical protein
MKKLLTTDNAKTIKGEKYSYKTYILYMSPFNQNDKGINLCSHASAGCAAACLYGSGLGGIYTSVQKSRTDKANYFLRDRVAFLAQLFNEIKKIKAKHDKKGEKFAIRLNGTTDIRYEKFKIFEDGTKNIFEVFEDVQFYDYTKNYLRFEQKLPKNYHLTFSRSESNDDKAFEILNNGFNVAMVFNSVPSEYKGFKVINGDESDLRFLDPKNQGTFKTGVIVGLKYKKLTGKGADNKKAINNNFVITI